MQVHFNLKKVGREAFISKKKKNYASGYFWCSRHKTEVFECNRLGLAPRQFVTEIFDSVLRISFL